MFVAGVILGALAGFGLGFMVGQDTAERTVIVFPDKGRVLSEYENMVKKIRKFLKRTWFLWLPGLTLWWHVSSFGQFTIPQQVQFAFAFQIAGVMIFLLSLNGTLALINRVSYWELLTGMRKPWENFKLGRPSVASDEREFADEISDELDRLTPKLDAMRAARMGGNAEIAMLKIKMERYVDDRIRELAVKTNLHLNRVDKLALDGVQSQFCGAIFGIYGTLVATALG